MKELGSCEFCQRAPAVASLRRSGHCSICLRCVRLIADVLPRIWARFEPASQAAPESETIEFKNAPSDDKFLELVAGFRAAAETALLGADVETHVDLGIAYREMGLITDAIEQFQIAMREASAEQIANVLHGVFSTLRFETKELREALFPS
jgi:hypothetical protein